MSDLTMYRGDTKSWDIACKLQDDSACSLVGAKLWFTAKRALADADASAIIAKSTTTSGLTITDAANGIARLTLVNTDTASLEALIVTLFYDLQVLESSGNLATVASGKLIIYPDSTKATS